MPVLRHRPEPPDRLIDPEGEGVYLLAGDHSWTLLNIAHELLGSWHQWRDLNYEAVWMREGGDDHWYRDRWRRRYTFLPERWWPVVLYAYITPKAGAA